MSLGVETTLFSKNPVFPVKFAVFAPLDVHKTTAMLLQSRCQVWSGAAKQGGPMSTIRRGNIVRRNDRCVCGSGKKFKHCCSPDAASRPKQYVKPVQYIDTGEESVRWVICDPTGVKFFSDKDNRILVFKTRAIATAIAMLDSFDDQEPGDINVAGVGATKWAHLQEILPYIEVDDVHVGIELIRERMDIERTKYETLSDQLDTPTPPAQEAAE